MADQLCSPNLIDHQFDSVGAGAEAIQHLKDAIRDVHGAVPDICFTIEDSVEQGDTIWVRVRVRGTATGSYFGPPSNRPVDFTVFDVARVAGGRIVEHWGVPDRFPCWPRPASSTAWRKRPDRPAARCALAAREGVVMPTALPRHHRSPSGAKHQDNGVTCSRGDTARPLA